MKKLNLFQWKKSVISICLLIGVFTCMCGCGKQSVNNEDTTNNTYVIEKIGDKLKNDSIYIVGENINYHLYSNISGVTGFQMECISTNKLNENELEVTIAGINTPYNVVLEEVEDEKMDVFLFAEYCGADWEKLKKLQDEDISAYNNEMKEYEKQLENSKKNINKIYHYFIGINFKFLQDGDTESFQNVTVKYKDQTYEQKIGNVVLDYDREISDGEALQVECIAASDISAWKNENGQMECNIEDIFQVISPVTINSVELLEKDAELDSCEINTVCLGKGMDYKWCGNALEFEKDTNLSIKLQLQKEECANQFYYQYNNYVLIAYKDKNKNYEAVAEFCFRTKMTAYEIYAHYLDNKDLTSYMNFVYSD